MEPFKIDVDPAELADLHRRIAGTRWVRQAGGDDWDRGVPEAYLRELAEHWLHRYDWSAAQDELNRLPQYLTGIDGATVHFVHSPSSAPDAVPILITSGWPGSLAEFLDVVGPLNAEGFHVVIASIPGYGFSTPLTEPGWDIPRVARAWLELMDRLGYERFVVQGGDWGSFISLDIARIAPERVLGAHVNFLAVFPSGDLEELAGLDDEDRQRLAGLGRFDADGMGYLKLLSTRPRTPAYGLNDSPVGLLAWIAEKYVEWSGPGAGTIDRDRLLTTVMLYWLPGAIGSSAQMYYEVERLQRAADGPPPAVTVPIGVAVFPCDCFLPVRKLAERAYPSITRWDEHDRGGHFPALEVPELYVRSVVDFARTLGGQTVEHTRG
ncbi:epoxide hydrolase family protein [Dactylosporangium siamense]|uniref:Microsomal epoxide hydrolase n=1 Tax=Dactylosporangium siamense TaxID=685454 RepID=A0A919PRQ2_9ACTN|nr:epoxide hydrolase family protein [Dactylosporangium siamense]GIG47183.1 microsomal epoxide hydrolase [Dactylosporangium siamense]